MDRINCVLLSALLCLFVAGAGAERPTIHFPGNRFSIAPLEGPAGAPGVLLTMNLPASEGFAPNVNVLCQAAHGTIDDYLAVSKQGMEKAGMQLIKADKLDEQTAAFEYTGKMVERSLHWYGKASLKGNHVILVTATATEKQWAKFSVPLQACVDSFQRDGDK